MEERLRFVARLLEGEAMSDVCRELAFLNPCNAVSSFSMQAKKALRWPCRS